MKKSLALAALAALTIAPAAAQKLPAPRTYMHDTFDVCTFEISGPGARGGSSGGKLLFMLYYRRDGGRSLEFGFEAVRIPKVRAHPDIDQDVVVRLETDAGQMTDRDGEYYTDTPGIVFKADDSVGGKWDGAEAEQAVSLLKKSRIFYVVAEGERYGPFDATAKGLAGFSLEACVKKASS